MQERWNRYQIEAISRFCADLAKIIFASSVVGFFIPDSVGIVSASAFIIGGIFAVGFFTFSVTILKTLQ